MSESAAPDPVGDDPAAVGYALLMASVETAVAAATEEIAGLGLMVQQGFAGLPALTPPALPAPAPRTPVSAALPASVVPAPASAPLPTPLERVPPAQTTAPMVPQASLAQAPASAPLPALLVSQDAAPQRVPQPTLSLQSIAADLPASHEQPRPIAPPAEAPAAPAGPARADRLAVGTSLPAASPWAAAAGADAIQVEAAARVPVRVGVLPDMPSQSRSLSPNGLGQTGPEAAKFPPPSAQPDAPSPAAQRLVASLPSVASPTWTDVRKDLPAAAPPATRPKAGAAAAAPVSRSLEPSLPASRQGSVAPDASPGRGIAPVRREAATAPPPRRSDGPSQGDVYLDGVRVGRWMSETLARAVGGPSRGSTGFDPRMGPRWPGALQGR